jgi:hypothetical protein
MKGEEIMAEEYHSCDVTQGFNFKRDVQNPLGHVKTLVIGQETIDPNMEVISPETGDKITVVGIISDIAWDGGDAHPISVTCQVSNSNKVLITGLTGETLHDTSVDFDFDIYRYDPAPDQRKFYKCFHTGDEVVKGRLQKSPGGKLSISIAQDASHEVESPLNFTLWFAVNPEEIEQALHVAHAVGANKTSRWGVPTT